MSTDEGENCNGSDPTSGNPLKNAGLTQLEIQAAALHLFDGCSLRLIADLQGGFPAGISRRLAAAINKLVAAGMCPACVNRQKARVTAVSKLGAAFEAGNASLNELIDG